MLNSFNTETLPNIHNSHNLHNISNGYGNFKSNDSSTKKNSHGQNKAVNSYATDYLNTVKENRSLYGNYVDNALAFDPHKEKKSVYNVVYETDEYNPWGKPGGGAPKLDTSTGQLATKIRGTLKWNLTGETEDDRINRLITHKQKSNQNLLMYKKDSNSPVSPRQPLNEVHRQATTYNYNYRDPYMTPSSSIENIAPTSNQKLTTVNPLRPPVEYMNQNYSSEMNNNNNNNSNNNNKNSNNSNHNSAQQHQNGYSLPITYSSSNFSSAQQNVPSLPLIKSNSNNNSYPLTLIEREAADRQSSKLLSKSNSFAFRSKAAVELNRISNKLYNDNQPTMDYPNSTYWFGRTGPQKGNHSATIDPFYQDARRHKLLDALENRSPRFNDYNSASAQPYAFSNSPRNIYGPNIPNYSN